MSGARVAIALIGAALCASGAAGAELRYEGTVSATTGRYFFDERTNTFTLANALALDARRWTVRATWPVLLQNTTLVTASGGGGVPSGGPISGAVADSGGGRRGMGAPRAGGMRVPVPDASVPGYEVAAGDPVLAVSWKAVAGPRSFASFGASVKAPVADVGDFGTGEWDFGGTAGLARVVGTRASLGLDASYWVLGDLPDLDFRNPVAGSASLGWLFSSRWAGVFSVTAGTSAVRGYDGPVSLGLAGYRYGDRSTLGLTVSAGLTDTAPDVSVALSIGRALSGRRASAPLAPLEPFPPLD